MKSEVIANRLKYLGVLRSGKYLKGCTKSDELGQPVIETIDDDKGTCACAIILHEFGNTNLKKAREALGLTSNQCAFIQRELNDSIMSFEEIADYIETNIFK